jgi:DNA repair protein RecO (recombination protein O)
VIIKIGLLPLRFWKQPNALLKSLKREPALQQYLLVVGSLKALAEKKYDPSLILDAYLLRSSAVAGYAPSLTICSRCRCARTS